MFRKLGPALPVAVLSLLVVSCSGAASNQQGSLDTPGTEAVAAMGWKTLKMVSYNYADTDMDVLGHFKTVPNACHQDAAGAIDVALWNRIATMVNRALTLPVLDDTNELCFERANDSKLFGTVDVVIDPTTAPGAPNALMAANNVPTPMISWPWPWPWDTHTPTPTTTVTPTITPTQTVTVTPTPTPTPTTSSHPTPTPSPSQPEIKRTILENRGSQICTTFKDVQLAKDLVDALDQVAAIAYKEDCERAP